MRELREFRERHAEFTAAGIEVAAINADTVESNRHWAERLRIPYPLLSDPDRVAAQAFGGLRRIALGDWSLEFFRRRTVLADRQGMVAAVWDKVRLRGHAAAVLMAARALDHPSTEPSEVPHVEPGDPGGQEEPGGPGAAAN